MSLPTTRLEKNFNPLKEYDREFEYSDEIEANLSQMMQEIENGPRVSGTTRMKEEAYRQHEKNVAMREESRFPNQEELKERRTGHILHMNAFAEKLRSAGVNVWYGNHEGMPGTTGMYSGHEGYLTEKCLEHGSGKPHYIGFIQVPFMQEFEELNFDAYNVPLGPKRRGWRTLGLRMIEQKIISEQKFHELFGEPPSGIVSRRYREYLQFLRNTQ